MSSNNSTKPTITSVEVVKPGLYPGIQEVIKSKQPEGKEKLEQNKNREVLGGKPGPRSSKGRTESRDSSGERSGSSSSKGRRQKSPSVLLEDASRVKEEERSQSSPDGRSRSPLRPPGVSGKLYRFWKGPGSEKDEMDEEDSDVVMIDHPSSTDKERDTSEERGDQPKEKRGRPPKTRKYIGVGQARKRLKEREQEDKEMEQAQKKRIRAELMEREMRDLAGLPPREPPLPPKCGRKNCKGSSITGGHEEDSSDEEIKAGAPKTIFKKMKDQATILENTIRKSKNIQGPCIKAMKGAIYEIMEGAQKLKEISHTEENLRLERENKKLRRDMEELKREVADLKKSMRTMKVPREEPRSKTGQGTNTNAPVTPKAGSFEVDELAHHA